MKISKTIEQFKTGQTNPVEYTHKVFDELEKINKEFYYFNTLCKEKALIQAEKIKKTKTGKLLGIPLSVKDAICVKDVETTAGSKILKGYLPTFNATCVNNAIKEGAIIVGKTSQDAFGFGSFNTNVGIGFKIPKNPFCKERCCGGSSGGSSGISQKTTLCHSSLGESTGGSIVAPAS